MRTPDLSPGPAASAETRLNVSQLHGEVEVVPRAPSAASVGRPTLIVGFKNGTDIAVREFWWEAALVEAGGAPLYHINRWHSRVHIKPGESEKLTHVLTGGRAWEEFCTAPRKGGRKLMVRVTRVKYANGWEWQRR